MYIIQRMIIMKTHYHSKLNSTGHFIFANKQNQNVYNILQDSLSLECYFNISKVSNSLNSALCDPNQSY